MPQHFLLNKGFWSAAETDPGWNEALVKEDLAGAVARLKLTRFELRPLVTGATILRDRRDR